ncbi:MAG: hypothetical protein ACLUSP_10210 [Christensenellales bacterium]
MVDDVMLTGRGAGARLRQRDRFRRRLLRSAYRTRISSVRDRLGGR